MTEQSENNKPNWFEVLQKANERYAHTIGKIQNFFNNPVVQNNINKMVNFFTKLAEFTEHQKKLMGEMSKYGWFPSTIIFLVSMNEDESIDKYMERCIVDRLDELEELLYSSHPTRKEIMEEAFRLFKEERYIAAIPLFISQIDGLGEDKNLTPFFSSDPNVDFKKIKTDEERMRAAKLPNLLRHALENNIKGLDARALGFYSEVINNAASSFILDRTPKVDTSQEINILNRNGIMHGHKDFLSYGTRINTLKVISLLLFVDHILNLIQLENDSE